MLVRSDSRAQPDSVNLKAFHDFKAGIAHNEQQGWVSPVREGEWITLTMQTGSFVRPRPTPSPPSRWLPLPPVDTPDLRQSAPLPTNEDDTLYDDMPRGECEGLGITIGGASFEPFGPFEAQIYVEPTSFAFDECRDVWAPRGDEMERIQARMADARKAAVSAQKSTSCTTRPPARRQDFARSYFSPPRPAQAAPRYAVKPFRPINSYAHATVNAPRIGFQPRFGVMA